MRENAAPEPISDPGTLKYVLLLIPIVAIGLALLPVRSPARSVLFELTGEENLVEGLKGLGALAWLKFTQTPLQTAPYKPIAHTDVNPYGVNTFLELEVDEANVRRSMEMIRDAGFHWIRQEFPWEDIEIHGKDDFQDRRTEPHKSAWTKYDRIVELADEYGLKIVARLDNPPAWSRAGGNAEGPLGPPDNFGDYGDFVEAVVRRYRGKIGYIQIWNEPNIYPEWGERPVDPEAYTELLMVAYRRAKAANPEVVVLSAGLAPTTETGPRNLNDITFLEQMYEAGAGDYFDVLSVMGYGLWTGPTDRRASAGRTNFSRPLLLRDVMVEHGDAEKPIWIMEMGWNAAPSDLPAPYGRVTEAQQARYATRAYWRARQEWPWAGVVFTWFFRRPDWEWHKRPEGYFRLAEPDWTTQPVYDAIQEIATSPPVVPIGYHQENYWALRYSDGWEQVEDDQAVLDAYLRSTTETSQLRFRFNGTSLTLVTLKAPGAGTFGVSIDGAPPQEIELGSTTPQYGVEIPLDRNLPTEEHRVVLSALGDGPVSIDGIIVRRDHTRVLREILGVLAALQAIVGLSYLLWVHRRTQ